MRTSTTRLLTLFHLVRSVGVASQDDGIVVMTGTSARSPGSLQRHITPLTSTRAHLFEIASTLK
jgi:hypothetical protein